MGKNGSAEGASFLWVFGLSEGASFPGYLVYERGLFSWVFPREVVIAAQKSQFTSKTPKKRGDPVEAAQKSRFTSKTPKKRGDSG
jgi:hypothetical protein